MANFKSNAGDVLFSPGQECAGFVALKSGSIKVVLTGESGREIVLYRVQPGQICLQTFSCLTQGLRYSAEGIAETDLEFELIPMAEFQRLIGIDADFRNQLFTAVATRFFDFERLVENVALSSIETRLANALLRLMDENHRVMTTQSALAIEIGTAREVVSRQLNRFAKKNLVKIARGAIEICAPNGLKKIAASGI